jgi:RHS repeat-associated protein
MTYSYTYDRYGNRWSQNTTQGWGGNFSAAFDATTNGIVTGGYAYDAAGNMTSDGFHNYTYDADGNILQVDGGATASYVYNGLNQRVRAQVGSGVTEYLYDFGGRRTSSWNPATNSSIEGRIYADGRQVAFRASDGKTYFDHQDYLGTESARTDATGALGLVLDYLPFGDGFTANVYETAAYQDSSQFGGLDQDDNSAGAPMSDHAQFRNYSFQQGRWLSPDPYDGSYDPTNPQSFNRYAYVLNNPLSYTDPQGTNYTDSNGNYCLTWNSTNSAGTIVSNVLCTSSNPSPSSSTNLPWFISEYGGAYGQPGGQCLLSDGAVVTCPQQPTTKSPAPTKPAPSKSQPYSAVKQYLSDVKNCFVNYAVPTLMDDLDPIPSDSTSGVISLTQSAADQLAQSALLAVGAHSISRGLTVPLRSSIVRAGLANAEAFGKLSSILAVVGLDYAVGDAVYAEFKGCL